MKCLDRFNSRMSLTGTTQREENIFNSRALLKETFYDDPTYTFDVFMWELNKENYDNKNDCQIPIRLYDRKFSNANGSVTKFQTPHLSPIVVGDVIYNKNEDLYWICTKSFDRSGINYEGELTECNWILKWQNANGEIVNYPCVDMNATQYNSGEQSNKQFVIGSSQHMITLPCDINTVVLNTPQRFFLDYNYAHPTVFQVTQNDTTSYHIGHKGLVKVTLMEDPYNPDTDRIDLGICDYVEEVEDALAEFRAANIGYKSDVIKSGGSARYFYAVPNDPNGDFHPNIKYRWRVICKFKKELEINENGNRISIAIDNEDRIGETIRLVLYCGKIATDSLLITVGSLL